MAHFAHSVSFLHDVASNTDFLINIEPIEIATTSATHLMEIVSNIKKVFANLVTTILLT